MTATLILDIALMAIVTAVIVGGLGWSIARDKTARFAGRRAIRA